MSKIDANLIAAAQKIAYELNKKDGSTSDNKILKTHWDAFALNKGAKDNVKEYIGVAQAEKSIYSYLLKNASKKESATDLSAKWLEEVSVPETSENQQDDYAHVFEIDEVVVTSERKLQFPGLSISENVCQFDKPAQLSITEVPVSTRVDRPITENIILNENKAVAEVVNKLSNAEKVENLIKQEMVKRGIKERNIDVPYWKERIANISSQFNIPEEIIVSIISRENGFTKNISNRFGKGAMALTGVAIRDFFPSEKGSWYDVYEQLDKKLLEDILYQKDNNGNLVMRNGKPVLKYRSSQELLNACGKNDELSIKVGSLIFEMQYVKAVAKNKYGRATYANIPRVIEQLKSGELVPDKETNEHLISLAVKNYNGCNTFLPFKGVTIKEDYRRDVMDSLKVQGFNFAEPIIKRT